MFIEKIRNNGKDYLRLTKAVRMPNKNGEKVSKKVVLLNIGPVDRYDDGKPDYLKRLKQSFKDGNPLIDSLKPYCLDEPLLQVWNISFKEGDINCFGDSKLCCNLIFEKIFEELGINGLCASYKNSSKIQYDLYGFIKLLTYGRILQPDSKCSTIKQNDNYIEPILKNDFNPYNVYDALDFIHEYKKQIIQRVNNKLVSKANRSPNIIYYDVTNFFFEIEKPDDNEYDDQGNLIQKGLRQMGVNKEERKLPIVQMGLFMDDDGIPISIEQFPGNTLDHQTFKPALIKTIKDLDFNRFILVADRGMYQGPNILAILKLGHGYIVSKSLLKSTKLEREWTYSDEDYISLSSNFKYKSRIVDRTIKNDDGTISIIKQKVVVYWSKAFQDKAEYENKKFLEFIDKLKTSSSSFKISSLQVKSLRRFMKNEYVNTKTGEVIESKDIQANIDYDKVECYKKSLGYYQIVTSELDMDDLEIIDKYHGLTQIENQFEVMKSTLQTRPIYVWTKEHIEAHLTICFLSLVIMRLIQKRLTNSKVVTIDHNLNWGYGISSDRVKQALNKWKVELLPNGLYRFEGMNDPDLKLILKAFNIDIKPKLYTINEIKGLKKQMIVF